jgi:hypothetical protein
MTTRLVGGLTAAAFAIGMLTGAAAIIVAREATTPSSGFASAMADQMDGQGMAAMMSGSMMGAGHGPGMMGGPGASAMPGSLHEQHHPAASQGGAQ